MLNQPSFKAALCAALLTFASGVSANTQEDPLFDKLDADMDGFVSRAEALKDRRIAERFNTLDTNQDEQLDKIEFEAVGPHEKKEPEPTPGP